jgi:SRSO17 transposase
LLALGDALGYRRLLKYNELTVEVASGAEAWRDFVQHADYDMLALAIQQAQRFYENLEATRHPDIRDSLVSHR